VVAVKFPPVLHHCVVIINKFENKVPLICTKLAKVQLGDYWCDREEMNSYIKDGNNKMCYTVKDIKIQKNIPYYVHLMY